MRAEAEGLKEREAANRAAREAEYQAKEKARKELKEKARLEAKEAKARANPNPHPHPNPNPNPNPNQARLGHDGRARRAGYLRLLLLLGRLHRARARDGRPPRARPEP